MHFPLIFKSGVLAAVLVLAAGCTTVQPSTPPVWSASSAPGCIGVVRALPSAQLPQDAVPFPGAPYVLVASESAAGLLVPIPFVTELVGGAMDRSAAASYQHQLGGIDPFVIAQQSLRQPPFAGNCPPGAPQLHPFVFLVEGHDGVYRLTLVFQLQQGSWIGRYHEHLPTGLAKAALQSATPALLETVRRELEQGSRLLADLMQRDLRGELPAHGAKVDIGSLYLIGGNVAGLVAPEHLHFKDTELIAESGDDLVLRRSGNMTVPGGSGALLFGVHHFRRSQLFYFQRQ